MEELQLTVEQRNKDLVKKPFQVYVIGDRDEQEGEQFILQAEEPSQEMKDRGMIAGQFMRLHLVEKFDAEAVFNPSLVRGLAYYTGPIFEAFLKDSPITSSEFLPEPPR